MLQKRALYVCFAAHGASALMSIQTRASMEAMSVPESKEASPLMLMQTRSVVERLPALPDDDDDLGYVVRTLPALPNEDYPVTEEGYQKVAALHNDSEMNQFVWKVLDADNVRVTNQGELNGLIPWFSGTEATQSLAQLRVELHKKTWIEKLPVTNFSEAVMLARIQSYQMAAKATNHYILEDWIDAGTFHARFLASERVRMKALDLLQTRERPQLGTEYLVKEPVKPLLKLAEQPAFQDDWMDEDDLWKFFTSEKIDSMAKEGKIEASYDPEHPWSPKFKTKTKTTSRVISLASVTPAAEPRSAASLAPVAPVASEAPAVAAAPVASEAPAASVAPAAPAAALPPAATAALANAQALVVAPAAALPAAATAALAKAQALVAAPAAALPLAATAALANAQALEAAPAAALPAAATVALARAQALVAAPAAALHPAATAAVAKAQLGLLHALAAKAQAERDIPETLKQVVPAAEPRSAAGADRDIPETPKQATAMSTLQNASEGYGEVVIDSQLYLKHLDQLMQGES